MDGHHAEALDRAVSPDRFGTFLSEGGGDRDRARELYVWDRDLASALLADIAIVEVALRNALNDALTRKFGPTWYTQAIGLDSRSQGELASAYTRLKKPQRTPGRVVAQLMLGFWVNILDSGGVVGREPQDFKMDYEQLWVTCLHTAFRGGRTEAITAGAQFTRAWTHEAAAVTRALRNRCAHHEPLLRGFLLPGQQRRLTVTEGRDTYLRLLRMVDRDLASWVAQNSAVDTILSQRP